MKKKIHVPAANAKSKARRESVASAKAPPRGAVSIAKAQPRAAVVDDDADPAESEYVPRLVRLNKFLADHGVASRRRCDELITEGKVSVDGESTSELGLKIDPERQEVEVGGFVFKAKVTRKRYYVLNKPSGVVCTNVIRQHATVQPAPSPPEPGSALRPDSGQAHRRRAYRRTGKSSAR